MRHGPLQLFLSYAREDQDMAADLRAHLAPLRYEKIVSDWYDRDLVAGADWDSEIRGRLERSDLVIALVSAAFLASSYAYGVEFATALELHRCGQVRLVPDWMASRLLRRGVIRYVQRFLLAEGLYAGPIDGEPGPSTERALVVYQRREGLVVDARIGPEVLERLRDTR